MAPLAPVIYERVESRLDSLLLNIGDSASELIKFLMKKKAPTRRRINYEDALKIAAKEEVHTISINKGGLFWIMLEV